MRHERDFCDEIELRSDEIYVLVLHMTKWDWDHVNCMVRVARVACSQLRVLFCVDLSQRFAISIDGIFAL